MHDHEQQLARDKELSKLAATAKYRERNRFNPLSQQSAPGSLLRVRGVRASARKHFDGCRRRCIGVSASRGVHRVR